MQPRQPFLLLVVLSVLFIGSEVRAAACGDCDRNGLVNILDALLAANMGASLAPWVLPPDAACDVDASRVVNVLDALRIAQFSAGTPVTLICTHIPPYIRAVDVLGTTRVPPVRGMPSAGDPEGLIFGWNQGEFNDTIQLGAGGNPVVQFEVAQTFQVVLEANLTPPLRTVDVTAAINPEGTTLWSSASSAVTVSVDGLLTFMQPNACSLISAVFTPTSGSPLTTEFMACLDLHGVDQLTRSVWLPQGEIDSGLVGMPSGPALPPIGGTFKQYYYFHGGALIPFLGLHLDIEWDPLLLVTSPGAGTSLAGSTASSAISVAAPFSEEIDVPMGRFHAVVTGDFVAPVPPLFDVIGMTWEVIGAGAVTINASLSSAGRRDGSPYLRTYPGGGAAASTDPMSVVPGKIAYYGPSTCTTTTCGDLNADGVVTAIDLITLGQYWSGFPLTFPLDNANVAGDVSPSPTAIVDIIDHLFILYSSIGAGVVLQCCP